MTESTKLCLVIPSLQAGGMERVMSELARYFAFKEDIKVHLVLYGISREVFYSIPMEVMVHTPSFKFNNRWRFVYAFRTLYYLRKTIKSINPATILSFGEYWNSFVLLSILGLKNAAYVSDRCQPDKSLGWFHDRLRIWLYPKAKGIVLQTEKAKEIYLKKKIGKSIIVIPNPIINFDLSKVPERRENSVLTVGRLIKSKNHDKLIEIFTNINNPKWLLRIVGYDHLKQHNMKRLKKLAKDLNAEQRILFMGKRDDLEKIYSNCSIFAFTSSSEGFPNVIGEAMAAGLPVIAFDCIAGPSELIKDNINGFLIPLSDFNQFQKKLNLLMQDERLREKFGQNARESILEYSIEKIGEKFYNSIL